MAASETSRYRKLRTRLEASLATQLQGAREAEAKGADGYELLLVSSSLAAAYRDAAIMTVRQFEGPEAAEAYAQQLTAREAASTSPAERTSL